MDIRHLRYFIAVAEERNFSRAAERLHMSQPPLSQQIKILEDLLQAQLFIRGRQGARLTRAGEALLVLARSIVKDCDSAEKLVRRVADGLEGYLRVGIVNSVMYGPLPRTLHLFQTSNPNVDWTLHELLPAQQEDALINGSIDVGFACSASERSELISQLVYPQSLRVAVPVNHALAQRPSIDLADIVGEDFVMLNTQSPMIRDVLTACAKMAPALRILHESTDPAIVLSLVDAGVGISLLPESLASVFRTGVKFVPLADSTFNANLFATRRRDDTLPALERFLEIIQVCSSEAMAEVQR
ncbi:LysR family transcriptional regulator [Pseudomonas sp. JQ170]|uniref:LysR substrate-binding domain-containing protein n=1 Tax=unclassified Pseudomonas TaxID=196821 RepID=UPI00264BD987|nr:MULTISPECIES: LysR substrate-binding domain-containing protein [unclassified Pseudomonas]MDN7143360.1 LysR family transcriptional regulator [Pseudomonas sp. JQ170]WRO78446.1 LysR substrate-binding domain-containing protein [Pseudomonas sp. 170C]